MKENKKEKIMITAGVLVEKRGELLLIRERNWMDGLYHWNIIKGTLDLKKDKDLMSAARRESMEEANANVKITGIVNILHLKKNGRLFLQFNFGADLVGSNFHISPKARQRKYGKDEDIVDAKMFSKKEIAAMSRKDFMGVRTYTAVKAWLKGEKINQGLIRTLKSY